MNVSALRHCSFYPFVQPLARDSAVFMLEAARDDLKKCTMVWWKRSEPEKIFHTAGTPRYSAGALTQWAFSLHFPEEAHYIKYHFLLEDAAGSPCRFNSYGIDQDEKGCFELLQINPTDVIAPPEWAKGCVYYQIFPERFARDETPRSGLSPWTDAPTRDNFLGGTLNGIRARLPYLKDLGVECLYLNPVFTADFNHKYATTDYFTVDPAFGGDEALAALVDAAHEAGIRVILDGVFNHTGIHFPPFADVLKNGAESRYADWFYLKKTPVTVDAACYECVGDYPYMPRLNGACPEVREYVKKILLYWPEKFRIDGWRLDVADELDKSAVRYWRVCMKRAFPEAVLLAETWGSAAAMVGPGGFDCAMNYLFRDAAVACFAKYTLTETAFTDRLSAMLAKYPDVTNHAMYNCLGSHDTARFLTEAGGDKRSLKLAMAFQMTFPGAPAVYYGDEIGMAGENDPGCRGGMAWQAMDEELLDWQKRLIALRKSHSALRGGSVRFQSVSDATHQFTLIREDDSEKVMAAFNLDAVPHPTDFAGEAESVDVPPRSVKIIIQHKEET